MHGMKSFELYPGSQFAAEGIVKCTTNEGIILGGGFIFDALCRIDGENPCPLFSGRPLAQWRHAETFRPAEEHLDPSLEVKFRGPHLIKLEEFGIFESYTTELARRLMEQRIPKVTTVAGLVNFLGTYRTFRLDS